MRKAFLALLLLCSTQVWSQDGEGRVRPNRPNYDAPAPSPQAATLTFTIQNQSPWYVVVKLFSRGRGFEWPGGDSAYGFNSGQQRNLTISCVPPEIVCYAAWTSGGEGNWGLGRGGQNPTCNGCCMSCPASGAGSNSWSLAP